MYEFFLKCFPEGQLQKWEVTLNPRLPDITILDMIFVYISISRYFHFIVYSLI